MTGKHHNWHRAWHRTEAGHLHHDSGLLVLVGEPDEDGGLDLVTDDASLQAWQAFEQARGVPLHDLQARLQRLLREAAEWHQSNA